MTKYMDHHSWLVEHDLMTNEIKDNVAMCGYCLIEDTKEVDTYIDFNNKVVNYKLLLPASLFKNLELLNKFKSGKNIGFFESFKLRKFLKNKKKNDDTGLGYDLEAIGNRFVRAYLNNQWNVKVEIFSDAKQDFWLK